MGSVGNWEWGLHNIHLRDKKVKYESVKYELRVEETLNYMK